MARLSLMFPWRTQALHKPASVPLPVPQGGVSGRFLAGWRSVSGAGFLQRTVSPTAPLLWASSLLFLNQPFAQDLSRVLPPGSHSPEALISSCLCPFPGRSSLRVSSPAGLSHQRRRLFIASQAAGRGEPPGEGPSPTSAPQRTLPKPPPCCGLVLCCSPSVLLLTWQLTLVAVPTVGSFCLIFLPVTHLDFIY